MSLFDDIRRLYDKKPLEDTSQDFVLRRFLSSDRLLARVCKTLALTVRKPEFTWAILQTALPRGRAPFFKYPCPKKGPAPPEVLKRIQAVHLENAEAARDRFEIMQLLDREEEYLNWLGVDAP